MKPTVRASWSKAPSERRSLSFRLVPTCAVDGRRRVRYRSGGLTRRGCALAALPESQDRPRARPPRRRRESGRPAVPESIDDVQLSRSIRDPRPGPVLASSWRPNVAETGPGRHPVDPQGGQVSATSHISTPGAECLGMAELACCLWWAPVSLAAARRSVAAPASASAASQRTGGPSRSRSGPGCRASRTRSTRSTSPRSAIHVKLHQQGQRQHRVRRAQHRAGGGIGDPGRRPDRVPAPALVHRARASWLTCRRWAPSDVADQFVPWTSPRSRRARRIYAYPQDAGPMIMMCNTALLEASRIAVPDDLGRVRCRLGRLPCGQPGRLPHELHGRPGPLLRPALAVRRPAVRGRRHQHHDRLHLTRGDPRRPALGRPAASGNLARWTPTRPTGTRRSATARSPAGPPARGGRQYRASAPDLSGNWRVLPDAAMGRGEPRQRQLRRLDDRGHGGIPTTRPRPRRSTAG